VRALETPERTAAAAVERARPPEPNSRARRESAPAAPPYARTRSAPRIPLTFPSSSRARSPLRPDAYDWESHYPEFFAKHRKKSADAEASGDAAAGPYSPPSGSVRGRGVRLRGSARASLASVPGRPRGGHGDPG
jgi:hypothetical protein